MFWARSMAVGRVLGLTSLPMETRPLPFRSESVTPVYLRVARQIEGWIRRGELVEGQVLPGERELASEFGVSRATLRRALHTLEGRHLLSRRQGSGTYISGLHIERDARGIISFTSDMLRRGLRPGGRILSVETRPATSVEAQILNLEPRDKVHEVRRLRSANDQPLALESNILPVVLVGPVGPEKVADGSLTEWLRLRGLSQVRAVRTIRSVRATPAQAQALGIQGDEPLLYTCRTAWLADGRPLEYAQAWYIGSRYDFVMELS